MATGYFAWPGTGRYLAYALGFKSWRVFLSNEVASSRIQFFLVISSGSQNFSLSLLTRPPHMALTDSAHRQRWTPELSQRVVARYLRHTF